MLNVDLQEIRHEEFISEFKINIRALWVILAHIYIYIFSKPKNACNIHNFEFACKKSSSYDNSKLCLTTVQIFRRVIRFMPPPFPGFEKSLF